MAFIRALLDGSLTLVMLYLYLKAKQTVVKKTLYEVYNVRIRKNLVLLRKKLLERNLNKSNSQTTFL